MNRIIVALISLLILLGGCTSEKPPAEPTPDLKAQIQSKLDMEKWLLDSRYLQHLCSMAADAIKVTFENSAISDPRMAVASMIESFKKPEGLIDSLNKLLAGMKSEENRLEVIAEKDIRIFDSLKRSNLLNSEFVKLISDVPESPAVFDENYQRIDDQLSSIVKILSIEYPQSTDELNARLTDDNIDYRTIVKMIRDIPTPEPSEAMSPVVDETEPTPTPTTPPIKTWRDKDGSVHMGYNAPEGAEIIELQSQLSGSVEVSEAKPQEQAAETQRSMIWVDKDGISHMGYQVPEGQEAKPADEIPLMIGN